MGGVYGKDAVGRIFHIQKVEFLIKYLSQISKKTPNSDCKLSNQEIKIIEKSIIVLKRHLDRILNDPYLLKTLMKEREQKTTLD